VRSGVEERWLERARSRLVKLRRSPVRGEVAGRSALDSAALLPGAKPIGIDGLVSRDVSTARHPDRASA
jgi:hypothetical protein